MGKAKRTRDPVEKGLDAIKRLLMLLLIKAGTPATEIARALGVAKSTLSEVFPARKITRFEAQKSPKEGHSRGDK